MPFSSIDEFDELTNLVFPMSFKLCKKIKDSRVASYFLVVCLNIEVSIFGHKNQVSIFHNLKCKGKPLRNNQIIEGKYQKKRKTHQGTKFQNKAKNLPSNLQGKQQDLLLSVHKTVMNQGSQLQYYGMNAMVLHQNRQSGL
jgi:hypothetical protein